MKLSPYSILSLLVITGSTLTSACTTAPPEQEPGDDDDTMAGDGDTSTGDGDTTVGGDGDTPVVGDGDGDGTTITGNMVTGELPYGHPDPATTYPEHDGFTLWLVEEFATALDLDADPIWTWSDGGLPEGQVRFVKDGIKFADGKMILEAKPDDGSFSFEGCSHAEVGSVFTKALTSGEMRTRHNLFRYGRYEVRMKAPSPNKEDSTVNGNYISTMFAFRTPKFEQWREIDIEVTGNTANSVTTNVITGDEKFEWNGAFADASESVVSGINTRDEFHDFVFEWLPTGITWTVDGQVIRTYTTSDKLPIPELSAKIMMNLWIFNATAAFGGAEIENNQYPMTAEYDWFRFYKWDGDETYPCLDMNESCLSADDVGLSSNNPCDGISAAGTVNDKAVCTATCQ